MSPRWLHWPAPVSVSAQYSVSGTLTSGSTSVRRNLSSVTESGSDSGTLDPYTGGDFLVNGSVKITVWLDVAGMSGLAFKTSMGSTATATLEANGVNLPLNPVTVSSDVAAGANYVGISCYGAGTNDENAWFNDNCTVGNSFTFTLSY